MKFGWGVLLVLLAGMTMPRVSQAQVSIYGEFSSTDLHNLTNRVFLNGATTGLLYDGPTFRHVVISADIQGRFVAGNGERLDGINVGPRFSFPMHRFGSLDPFAEFLVGFARFNGNATTAFFNGAANNSTTDGQIQINGGVSKPVSSHLDAIVDYSYSQYYAYGGQYNPKTFSGGVVYHFVKR